MVLDQFPVFFKIEVALSKEELDTEVEPEQPGMSLLRHSSFTQGAQNATEEE